MNRPPDPEHEMARFWDERARENPYYFVDNRLEYGSPDVERFWREGEEALDHLLQTAGVAITPTDEALDIGCGLGRLTRPLAARASGVWALDISREMLDRARAANPQLENVRWVLGDGSSLAGIPDGAIDACVSLVVFQHIPDPRVTLDYVREMGRVLRSDGWSAFQVSTDPGIHRRRGGLRERLRSLLHRGPGGQSHPAWLGSAASVAELEDVAAQAGMDVENIAGAGTQFCVVTLRKH